MAFNKNSTYQIKAHWDLPNKIWDLNLDEVFKGMSGSDMVDTFLREMAVLDNLTYGYRLLIRRWDHNAIIVQNQAVNGNFKMEFNVKVEEMTSERLAAIKNSYTRSELIYELKRYFLCDVSETERNAQPKADTKTAKKGERPAVEYKCDTPETLYRKLGEYVIGQDDAKRAVCTAAYSHFTRLALKDDDIKKANLMLIGPTGSGKTHLVSSLARILDVPFASISAAGITANGYSGGNVTDFIDKLGIQAINYWNDKCEKAQNGYRFTDADISERMESAIVFIDEVDKIHSVIANNSAGRDINGESVQQAFLTLLEGTETEWSHKFSSGETFTFSVNTKNMLFILGGAFADMPLGIRRRLLKSEGVVLNEERNSFGALTKPFEILRGEDVNGYLEIPDDELLALTTEEDLENYGFISEFIGRIPTVAALNPLTETDFVKILTSPKDALVKQYGKMLRHDGVEIFFTNRIVGIIAREGLSKHRGARGLRTVFEGLMSDILYIAPSLKEFKPCIMLDFNPETMCKVVTFYFPKKDENEIKDILARARFTGSEVKLIFDDEYLKMFNEERNNERKAF